MTLRSSLLPLTVGLALLVAGCGPWTPEQVEQARETRQRIDDVRVATTQAAADLERELATLPPDDPVRRTLEPRLAEARAVAERLERELARVDAVIRAGETGSIEPLRDAARGLPYGELIVGVIGIGAAWWQQLKAARYREGLRQTVDGLARTDLPDQIKAALRDAQDRRTKVLVEELKQG